MKTTVEQFKGLQAEALKMFKEKNADYGDSFREEGILGVMVRQKDKLSRLITLARKEGEGAVKDESVRDTLKDYSNYGLMAILAHEDGVEWGKAPAEEGWDNVLAGGEVTVYIDSLTGEIPDGVIDNLVEELNKRAASNMVINVSEKSL